MSPQVSHTAVSVGCKLGVLTTSPQVCKLARLAHRTQGNTMYAGLLYYKGYDKGYRRIVGEEVHKARSESVQGSWASGCGLGVLHPPSMWICSPIPKPLNAVFSDFSEASSGRHDWLLT